MEQPSSSSSSPARFDPLTQNVTFLGPDGKTPIAVPMPAIDAFSTLSLSVTINYSIQIGACLVLLLAVLAVTTPSSKLRRPSALLHLLALAVVVVRNSLLVAYFLSPIVGFYPLHSGDFSSVPPSYLRSSVAGSTVSVVLVVVVEAALMNQAWTMVTLWPDPAKYGLAAASLLVTLLTVGFRLAYTVFQNEAVLALAPAVGHMWVTHAAVVTNAVSIIWFCALCNLKLVMHLVRNRGILPSAKTLTSMELLVMTNGVLMVVPGLEWGTFQNFESGSLTLTSVALILPLGTLAAQQISLRNASASNTHNFAYYPKASSASSAARKLGSATTTASTGLPSFKIPSMTTSCGSSPGTRRGSLLSRCERGGKGAVGTALDHFNLELRQIDSTSALAAPREQHDEKV